MCRLRGDLAVHVAAAAIFLDRRLIALMGVAGVGIATVISQMVSCVLVLICLYRAESSYQLRLSKLTMKGVYLKQIFQVGVPAGIQSTVINFSNVLLQSSVNSFGSTRPPSRWRPPRRPTTCWVFSMRR